MDCQRSNINLLPLCYAGSNKEIGTVVAPTMAGFEGEAPQASKIPYWRLVFDPKVVTDEVINHPYAGRGTDDDPFVVFGFLATRAIR